jgi:hypothetical protein
MIENKMTVGQMIDHLGLNASYRPPHGLALSSDGVLVWSDCASGIYASWPGEFRYLFDSLEEALRWLCERKDHDFQIDSWELHRNGALRIYVHRGTGPRRFIGNFILFQGGVPVWTSVEFKGSPRPTDEQLDDLVRNHEVLGLICEQMWGIPPKEEA